MFMPPSINFPFSFSSLHFRPFSALSPPVNYLLSVRLGQELHFPSDGAQENEKERDGARGGAGWKEEKLRRRWPSGSRCSSVQDALTSICSQKLSLESTSKRDVPHRLSSYSHECTRCVSHPDEK